MTCNQSLVLENITEVQQTQPEVKSLWNLDNFTCHLWWWKKKRAVGDGRHCNHPDSTWLGHLTSLVRLPQLDRPRRARCRLCWMSIRWCTARRDFKISILWPKRCVHVSHFWMENKVGKKKSPVSSERCQETTVSGLRRNMVACYLPQIEQSRKLHLKKAVRWIFDLSRVRWVTAFHTGKFYTPQNDNMAPARRSFAPKGNVIWTNQKNFQVLLLMAEIPNNHLGWCWTPINNGINYQPQLVFAGFLSHQQYVC